MATCSDGLDSPSYKRFERSIPLRASKVHLGIEKQFNLFTPNACLDELFIAIAI